MAGEIGRRLFEARLDELAKEHELVSTLFVFSGLDAQRFRWLAESPLSPDWEEELLTEDGFLDVAGLKATVGSLIMTAVTATGPWAVTLEQATIADQALPQAFTGDVVLVSNNLFADSRSVPSAVRPDVLETYATRLEAAEDASEDALSRCYAGVTRHGDEWLVSPKQLDLDCPFETVGLFDEAELPELSDSASSRSVLIPGAEYASLRLRLMRGESEPVSLVVDERSFKDEGVACSLRAFVSLAEAQGADCTLVSARELHRKKEDPKRLLPVLRHYWGPEASFRKLRIYGDPDVDNRMEEVSQGEIADFAVEQAEATLAGSESCHDLFVTAPTGAGKSLLFQLPALYLEKEHQAVTIVVEPLKALMKDQVYDLQRRGVGCVATLNSDLTYQERMDTYERIKTGEVSIVYMAPELLLATSLEDLLAGRRLGLVVIDEVHTVTSWGKDFRPDYWYLGQYLSKYRKRGMRFPVFCLTATAVYGGRDDVVLQTIRDLELEAPRLWLGNPRRDDITFAIRRRSRSERPGGIDEAKVSFAVEAIQGLLEANAHAIVYCPYRSHVESIMKMLDHGDMRVLGYHGGMDKEYKDLVAKAFKSGSCRVLVSTKAFGMGIDVSDITVVYHYAPTGNLADYVQEIGRAARDPELDAVASIDFLGLDSQYARRLYGMSRFYNWQLRDILGKLYEVYLSRPAGRRSRNFLVSPNSFSYLFTRDTDDTARANRVKSALMMIAKDLEERFSFPVIIVRPNPTFTRNYVSVPAEMEEGFIAEYGSYAKKVSEGCSRIETRVGQRAVKVSDLGSVFLLETAKMWEERFPEYTFADFKRRLFTGEIIPPAGEGLGITNRVRLQVNLKNEHQTTLGRLEAYALAVEEALRELSRGGEFGKKEFESALERHLGSSAPALKRPKMLLDFLVRPVDNGARARVRKHLRVVKRRTSRKASGVPVMSYVVKPADATGLRAEIMTAFRNLVPEGRRECERYMSPSALGVRYEVAELLQVLELGSYEARGGDNPEIFVRLNDPTKVRDLAGDSKFNNLVLKDLNERHEYSENVMTRFFTTEMSDSDRWDLVEEYFLGNDAYVSACLGLPGGEEVGDEVRRKVRPHQMNEGESRRLAMEVVNAGTVIDKPYFRIWRDVLPERCSSLERKAAEKLKNLMRGSGFERPALGAVLRVEGDERPLFPLLAWEGRGVALFDAMHAADYERAQASDWTCYLLGAEGCEALVEDVRVRDNRAL